MVPACEATVTADGRKRAAATVVERWYPSDPNEFSADLCREVEYPGMGGTWMDH